MWRVSFNFFCNLIKKHTETLQSCHMAFPCVSAPLRVATSALLTWLVLTGSAQGRSLEDVRTSNQLRVCVAGSSAAFYRANAEAFARHLGVPAVVKPLKAWDDQFQNRDGQVDRDGRYVARLLENGECDLFPNDLHLLDWRLSKMDLVPYYTVRKMIVAHQRLRATVRTPADLAGLRAAVQKGTSYDTWLTHENTTTYQAKPVQIDHHPTLESVQRVSRGLADFTVTGSEGAFKWIRSGDFENLDLLFPVDDIVSVGWGIAPSSGEFREVLQRYFDDSLRVGSELDRSWQRYYGISRTEYRFFEQSLDTRAAEFAALRAWALPVGTGFAGVMVAMALWTGRLRREAASHRQTADRLARSQQALERESSRRLVVSQIQLALQQASTPEAFAQTLLSELSRHIPFQQALLCAVDGGQLRVWARYAGTGASLDAELRTAAPLASLMHEALQRREDMVIEPGGETGLRVSSSMGSSVPATVLIHPIHLRDHPVAVLELASLGPMPDNVQVLLSDLRPFVAVSLERLRLPAHRDFGG